MPKRSEVKLSDKLCREASPPARGYQLTLCSATKGLGLRVTSGGSRSFVFSFVNAQGRQRRITIGAYPEWSLSAARKRASELRQAVDRGDDPLAERQEARAAVTLDDLWSWYQANAFTKLAPRTQEEIVRAWSRHILPRLGRNTLLKDLERRDVQKMVDGVTAAAGPQAANLAFAYLRRPINLAVVEGYLDDAKAVRGIVSNPDIARDRFLSPAEMSRLFAALDEIGTVGAMCVKFIALTGCRRGEAQTARWSDIDLDRRVWDKPPGSTKQKKRHVIPLSDAAVDVLSTVEVIAPPSEFVFPGKDPERPIRELKGVWRRARERAKIENCRIHDLRHSFASMIASNGGSLLDVGALLGHSNAQTSARYAHLFDERLRDAANKVADAVRDAV